MTLPHATRFATVVALLWVGAAPEGRARARVTRSNIDVLTVTLVAAAQLPDAAYRVMTTEAERIWGQEGIGVRWNRDAASDSGATLALRVVFVQTVLRPPASTREFAIAEFHRAQRRIVMSLRAAERAVEGRETRTSTGSPTQPHDRALGLVLGRALAHEIGHYLLGTAEHSPRGLMRASIPARDLVDPRAANFFQLDTIGAALLTARLDAGLLTPTSATH